MEIWSFLTSVAARLDAVKRWARFAPVLGNDRPSVLAHSFESLLLIDTMLLIEAKVGRHVLNEARQKRCAKIHDLGEGLMKFDPPYPLKSHHVIGPLLTAYERQKVVELLQTFPAEVHAVWEDAYRLEAEGTGDDGAPLRPFDEEALQFVESRFSQAIVKRTIEICHQVDLSAVRPRIEQTLDGEFFKATEHVGYMMFAITQAEAGHREFLDVLRRHHPILMGYADRFESVGWIYEAKCEYVETQLAML